MNKVFRVPSKAIVELRITWDHLSQSHVYHGPHCHLCRLTGDAHANLDRSRAQVHRVMHPDTQSLHSSTNQWMRRPWLQVDNVLCSNEEHKWRHQLQLKFDLDTSVALGPQARRVTATELDRALQWWLTPVCRFRFLSFSPDSQLDLWASPIWQLQEPTTDERCPVFVWYTDARPRTLGLGAVAFTVHSVTHAPEAFVLRPTVKAPGAYRVLALYYQGTETPSWWRQAVYETLLAQGPRSWSELLETLVCYSRTQDRGRVILETNIDSLSLTESYFGFHYNTWGSNGL